MCWILLYFISSVVYDHEELYNNSNNFSKFGYSRYNSQGTESAWNFYKKQDNALEYEIFVENIRWCYLRENEAYLVSTNNQYIVLDTISGDYIVYIGSNNINNNKHFKIYQFISKMHKLRHILFGDYKTVTVL